VEAEDAFQRFVQDREQRRKGARLDGLCSRCTVRRGRPGKAYCQHCTDYAKRYAREQRARRMTNGATRSYDPNPNQDKVAKIRGLRSGPGDPGASPREEGWRVPETPAIQRSLVGPLPHRRDELFADLRRARSLGLAPVPSAIPIDVGMARGYDELDQTD
jgi:hypothetical protein